MKKISKTWHDGNVIVNNGVVTMDESIYNGIGDRFKKQKKLSIALGTIATLSVGFLIFKAVKK